MLATTLPYLTLIRRRADIDSVLRVEGAHRNFCGESTVIIQLARLRKLPVVGFAMAVACLTSPDCSWAIHFDYLVEQDSTGNLVTGSNDFDSNTQTIPDRLFYRDLDVNFFGSDPGFSAVSQTNVPTGYFALPANTPVSFDLLGMPLYASTVSNLWYWNGHDSDPVNFQPVSLGTTLTMNIGFTKATVDGSSSNVTGFTIQTTDSTGAIHRHPNYQLAGGPGGVPSEGLYMIAEQTRMPGLQHSIPFYTIFVTDSISDASYNAAVQWGLTHLLLPGDVTNDAVVNGLDIAAIASHWLVSGPIADANYDGVVNGLDIALVASNWLHTSGGGSGIAAAVPEPLSVWLAVLSVAGAAVMLRCRMSQAQRS